MQKKAFIKKNTPNNLLWSFLIILGVAAVIISAAIWIPYKWSQSSIPIKEAAGAKEALLMLKDWTTWMSGIQTATIAALGMIAKDGAWSLIKLKSQQLLVVVILVLNSVALLLSGWLLTATSSIMLRIYKADQKDFDFYNYPLYAFMKEDSPFTVAFLAISNHWLWGISVALFAVLSVSIGLSRQ